MRYGTSESEYTMSAWEEKIPFKKKTYKAYCTSDCCVRRALKAMNPDKELVDVPKDYYILKNASRHAIDCKDCGYALVWFSEENAPERLLGAV